VCVPFQSLIFGPETSQQEVPCELEHCHGGELNHWAKVQAFFYEHLHVITSIFPHKLGLRFGLMIFKVNSKLDIEKYDEHCLHLRF
jgi:hypothetical protein